MGTLSGSGKQAVRRGRDELAETAVHVDAQQLECLAHVLVPRQAGHALPAGDDRVHHDPIARLPALHALADLDDRPAELVSLDRRVLHPAVELAAIDVQIRSTDPGVARGYQYLVRRDLRVGRVPETDVPVVLQNCCFHLFAPCLFSDLPVARPNLVIHEVRGALVAQDHQDLLGGTH